MSIKDRSPYKRRTSTDVTWFSLHFKPFLARYWFKYWIIKSLGFAFTQQIQFILLYKTKALLFYRKLNSVSLLPVLSPEHVFIRNTYCDHSTLIGQHPGFCCVVILTFRHHASCILGQAFHYSRKNAFYILNQQIYFIIWYLLERASLI